MLRQFSVSTFVSDFWLLVELVRLNAYKGKMNCIPASTGTAVAHAELRRFTKKIKRRKKNESLQNCIGCVGFNVGHRVVGFRESGNDSGQGHRRNRRFSGVFQDVGRRGKSGWIG